MEANKVRIAHLVNVWFFNDTFFVSPSIVDHITWRAVKPVFEVALGNTQELSNAIEKAKNVSNAVNRVQLDPAIIWDRIVGSGKDKGEIGNKATADWSIAWYEDGRVKISPMKKMTKYKGVSYWQGIKEQKIELPNTASFQEIAELLKP